MGNLEIFSIVVIALILSIVIIAELNWKRPTLHSTELKQQEPPLHDGPFVSTSGSPVWGPSPISKINIGAVTALNNIYPSCQYCGCALTESRTCTGCGAPTFNWRQR